jgi:phosphodiesterase/alkaline phosphatase D-like protein
MIEFVGLPGDYYSWRWADALFVVIDPYWHSPTAVDSQPGSKGKKHAAERRNMWNITLGEAQYRWFKKTLEESDAAYKFVFAHHVLGTGRGGIENANLYEWGGRDQKGAWEFESRRPGWQQPIQQLMAENKVDIFFQGHDHLFARQELDGVVYQEVPCPADPTFSAFNADSYTSGTILPNSGYLRVTVSSQKVTVDYVKSYLPNQETATEYNGMVAYSYVLPGGKS